MSEAGFLPRLRHALYLKGLAPPGSDFDAKADPRKLAAIGRRTARKLKHNPRVIRLAAEGAQIYHYPRFLSPADCAELIAMIDATAQPSKLYSRRDHPGYRTSYSGNLDAYDPFVLSVEKRICTLLGIDPEHGETLQGQRYSVGQRFGTHPDYLLTNEDYWQRGRRSGGQRSWTAMIYLNEPKEGGHTEFPNLGFAVPPLPGTLLTWNNMRPDGTPNPLTMHCGQTVTKGKKYIVTKWFRQDPWLGEGHEDAHDA